MTNNQIHLPQQSTDLEKFNRDGFMGPFTLLEKANTRQTLKNCRAGIPNSFLPNPLARHTVVKSMAELGKLPDIISRITPLLGNDFLLWGSVIIRQMPSKKKRFHVDAEFSAIEGLAIWLGMQNVVPGKTFFLIAGSHKIRESPQELNKLEGLDITDSAAVLSAAKNLNPECKLVKVDITDGQYIIFHGRLWHGTENTTTRPRYAINFRYAKPSHRVRISKDGELPDVHWESQLPVCLMVNGKDEFKLNKIMKRNKISRTSGFLKGVFYYLPKNFLKKYKRKGVY